VSDVKLPIVFSSPVPASRLASHTEARVALGRAGASLPTGAHLKFVGDHARARDAVWTAVDFDALGREASELGLTPVRLRSEAEDRAAYLRRPDLGRRLSAESQSVLAEAALSPQGRVALVIADGLSAEAVQTTARPVVRELLSGIVALGAISSVFLVEQGRVAIGDPIGEALGAELVVVLIGERPGLSAADSLGCYITWAPKVGTPDSRRNCVSNIRHRGLEASAAAVVTSQIIQRIFQCGGSGVELLPSPNASQASLPVGDFSDPAD
jgi:ethanolamine ammonia-lyase small subunit